MCLYFSIDYLLKNVMLNIDNDLERFKMM